MKSLLLFVFTIIYINAYAQPWPQQVKDVCPGTCGSESFYHTAHNGTVYYMYADNTHGTELWATDGSTVNTRMVKDIDPSPVNSSGAGSSFPHGFCSVNGKMVFCAFDYNTYRYFVWVTDGTDTGTKKLANISVDNQQGPVFMQYGQNAYFINDNTGHLILSKTNGIDTGTYTIKILYNNNPPYTVNKINDFTLFNNKLCFAIGDLKTLYITDGTPGGTLNIIMPVKIMKMTAFQNMLYFIGSDYKLYKTDGTTSGTSLVSDFGNTYPKTIGTLFTTPTSLVIVNSKVWKSDGTTSGTTLLNTPPVSGQSPVMLGYKLFYFTNNYNQPQAYLVLTDLSTGTSIIPDTTVTTYLGSRAIKIFKDKLYFEGTAAYTNPDGTKSFGKSSLYTYDITRKKMNPIPGITTNGTTFSMATLGDEMILCANDSISGLELWKITDFTVNVPQTNIATEDINLYPNPAYDKLTLRSASNKEVSYRIVNMYGQVVLHGNTVYSKQIDISALPAAVYNIIIQSANEETITRRFVKL